MRCPHRGRGKHRVIDTRKRGETIRHHQQCLVREQRSATYESFAPGLFAAKRNGHREPFVPQKLFAGIRIAAVKRQVSSERMKSIADYVEERIQGLGRAEVTSERTAILCWINWPMSVRWPSSVSPVSILTLES